MSVCAHPERRVLPKKGWWHVARVLMRVEVLTVAMPNQSVAHPSGPGRDNPF